MEALRPVKWTWNEQHVIHASYISDNSRFFKLKRTCLRAKKSESRLNANMSMSQTKFLGDTRKCAKDPFTLLQDLMDRSGGCAIIDGGLATELERRGADINDPLWSAKCLLDDELADLVKMVHLDYFRAGADVAISASYQATIQGFAAKGIEEKQAEQLLERSVQLVCDARDEFWRECQEKAEELRSDVPTDGFRPRQRPLVAASIGSYGAFLADGSEYTGDYGPEMRVKELVEFHRRRLQVLAGSGADILAAETIPCKEEAEALVQILEENDISIPTWISFNSKDGVNVVKGDSFVECVNVVDRSSKVVAVGINCTPPRFILGLIQAARKVTTKPIVVYPNSGESWDGIAKQWVKQESTGATDDDFSSYVPEWVKAGANLLGGCCRTTPHTVRCICDAIYKKPLIQIFTEPQLP